jgi:hypothetical protein
MLALGTLVQALLITRSLGKNADKRSLVLHLQCGLAIRNGENFVSAAIANPRINANFPGTDVKI